MPKPLLLVSVLWCWLAAAWADAPVAGKQVDRTLEFADGYTMGYLLYLPEEYDSDDKKWPLLLFLHGRGESNGSLDVVKTWGPPRWIEMGEKYPYVVASPQCPADQAWSDTQQQSYLLGLLNYLQDSFKIDTDRIYLTGLSMGGYGSLILAADQPGRFAALLSISCGGKTEDAARLKDVPIWIFAGRDDETVPYEWSANMADALIKAGNQHVLFTSVEHIGHNCWSAAYALPGVYDWLDAQSLADRGSGAAN